MNTYIYDIEIFPNYVLLGFLDIKDIEDNILQYQELKTTNRHDEAEELLKSFDFTFFEFTKTRHDYLRLRQFMRSVGGLIGYNSLDYDDKLLKFIINKQSALEAMYRNGKSVNALLAMYRASQEHIFKTDKFIKSSLDEAVKLYKKKFVSIDLQVLNYLDKKYVSLKQVQINMNWWNVQEFSLPPINMKDAHYYKVHVVTEEGNIFESADKHPELIDTLSFNTFDRYIIDEFKEGILYYNINDILSTGMLFIKSKKELSVRKGIIDVYRANVLTQSRAKTADILFFNFYNEKSGLSWWDLKNSVSPRTTIPFEKIIDKRIVFETPILKELYSVLYNTVFRYGSSTFGESVIFDKCKYVLGIGGLHSEDRPKVFKSTKDYDYIDADAKSYYPSAMINLKLTPNNLNSSYFIPLILKIKLERLKAKALKDSDPKMKLKAEALKIVINAIYGKTADQYSWFFDPYVTYSTTINCQLYLLKLIEMLSVKGIQTISANTDGIICKVYKDRYDEYIEICKEWERLFDFELEFNKYTRYIRRDVNNYIADTGKYSKLKGIFVSDIALDKGYSAPIVPKAVTEFFLSDVPIRDTIYNSIDIFDFIYSVKIGKQFDVEFHTLKEGKLDIELLQHNNRYFISTDGGSLLKSYKNQVKKVSVMKGYKLTIMNEFKYVTDFKDYNINYNFYRMQAMEIYNRIIGNKPKVVHKQALESGTMFDELET